MSTTRFPMKHLGGTHNDELLVSALIPHGAGVREIGIEVPKSTILALSAILQYPCCQEPHSMPHALHHLNTGDPSCGDSKSWFPKGTGAAFYITQGPFVHIGINLPVDGGRDAWIVQLDVAEPSFRSMQPSSSLPNQERFKKFLTQANAERLSSMVRNFIAHQDYTPQNIEEVWFSFVTGSVAHDVEVSYIPTTMFVSQEMMSILRNRRVQTRERVEYTSVEEPKPKPLRRGVVLAGSDSKPVGDLWPDLEFLRSTTSKETLDLIDKAVEQVKEKAAADRAAEGRDMAALKKRGEEHIARAEEALRAGKDPLDLVDVGDDKAPDQDQEPPADLEE